MTTVKKRLRALVLGAVAVTFTGPAPWPRISATTLPSSGARVGDLNGVWSMLEALSVATNSPPSTVKVSGVDAEGTVTPLASTILART